MTQITPIKTVICYESYNRLMNESSMASRPEIIKTICSHASYSDPARVPKLRIKFGRFRNM